MGLGVTSARDAFARKDLIGEKPGAPGSLSRFGGGFPDEPGRTEHEGPLARSESSVAGNAEMPLPRGLDQV